jgi:hypothetical protein
MLTFKRIFNENGIMRYEFYPSGDLTAPGVVEFNRAGEPKLIQDSLKDVKGYFATHALYHIDTSKESGTVAWY